MPATQEQCKNEKSLSEAIEDIRRDVLNLIDQWAVINLGERLPGSNGIEYTILVDPAGSVTDLTSQTPGGRLAEAEGDLSELLRVESERTAFLDRRLLEIALDIASAIDKLGAAVPGEEVSEACGDLRTAIGDLRYLVSEA